ncbi:MAG TPA: hypothetical protein DEP10_13100 [Alphaproteobacteria bacterium]|nr:hypothetical protein [Alphaproteobacteria bacterium]|tara:strand:+ start:2776 stop:3966 length:1191 start_codon:yes stop_codon:yes gene_type:complete
MILSGTGRIFALLRSPRLELPFAFWMLLSIILLGLVNGSDAKSLISTFNSGWGYAAGEFALILIPAFILAGCVDRLKGTSSPLYSVLLSPVLGANMICPDTAHVSLSSMAKRSQLKVGFGAYAGFKLLFPAGPLIVATSLGGVSGDLMLYGLLIFMPVWLIGLAWAHFLEPSVTNRQQDEMSDITTGSIWLKMLPFVALIGLVFVGFNFEFDRLPALDFATDPKGALILASLLALAMIRTEDRAAVVESGLRRAASILLIIGLASALSAFLTQTFAIDQFFGDVSGIGAIIALFSLTAFIKVLQGSSMATFAAVGPLALPVVETSGLPPSFAVLAICLGSFIAILPNDSFYWLLKETAFKDSKSSDVRIVAMLGGGACLQALIGLSALLALYVLLQ